MKKSLLAAAFSMLAPSLVFAATNVFYNLQDWQAAAQAQAGSTQLFATTSSNIAKANEVNAPPSADTQLGGVLTFQSSITGTCGSFTFYAFQSGAGFTFDDEEPTGPVFPGNTLSIGDKDDYEHDDFALIFGGGMTGPRAVGFYIVDNNFTPGERVTANDGAGVPMLVADLPGYSATGAFVGFVSTEAIGSVGVDEGNDDDDIALKDIWLAPNVGEDVDGDQLSDCHEVTVHGTNPNQADSDNDGLNDGDEVNVHGTNPNQADSDNDGLNDGDEVNVHSTNPNQADSDNDGLNDGDEVNVHGTNPNQADSDNDGLNDGDEVNVHGTNPNQADSDNDGLNDGDEVNVHGTNPNNPDTDNDGLHDGFEVQYGFDPVNTDESGDDVEPDGLTNLQEQAAGTNPNHADSDNDGLNDGDEINVHGTDPINEDSDYDSIPDGLELSTGRDPLVTNWLITAGVSHTCALDDNGVQCWGRNDYGQTTVPNLSNPAAVSAGGSHTCALDDNGLQCWGAGSATTPPLSNPVAVSVGVSHTCALDDNGVQCWGANSFGQTTVPTLTNPFAVSAGDQHTCAIDENGVQCWGGNDFGQTTVPSLSNPVVVSAGGWPTCAIEDNGMQCWGTGTSATPTLSNPVTVSAGTFHACALDDNGLQCWGTPFFTDYGQTIVPNLSDPVGVSAGDSHTCALDDNGVQCWGRNDSSQTTVPDLAFDKDLDGLMDRVETNTGIYVSASDTGTDPQVIDTDGDGLNDGVEVNVHSTNPNQADSDNDGLNDGDEVNVHGTNPNQADSDNDGLNDGDEVNVHGTNPNQADSDNDGLNDGDEFTVHGTDPNNPDTDNDGLHDGFEVQYGFDPVNTDESGDDVEPDGLTNLQEQAAGTNPNHADSDNDCLNDGDEINVHGTDPNNEDTDGDGLLDSYEVQHGYDPLNANELNNNGTTIEDFDDQIAQGIFPNDVYAAQNCGGPYATFIFEELVEGSGNFAYRIDADSPDADPSTASAVVPGFTHSDYFVSVNVTQWNVDTVFAVGGFIGFSSGYVFGCTTTGCQLVRLDEFFETQLDFAPVSLDPNHVYRMEISRGGARLDEHRAALHDLTAGGNLVASLQATDATYAEQSANPTMAVQAIQGPFDSPYVVAYFDNFIAYDSENALNVPTAGWLAQAMLSLALCGSVAVWRSRK